ncbi:tRNA (adenosine(37)-N6)-dimethylallyltransferase MiaA [Deferribacter autotrophicus]|uniref:tRNA dimethylallyltransferase n=1 Tax=Deferribacter autotrophicus TaxID=500465 RepID=A0A5A8F290_9BACT|nr:tRNA (adenosine(37)-N6)-dimethylallyltransferase MiaA [Deferribacter autotrophicus]KAA0257445.1 tRNA (adenosine(37)-N6)-dimethylallyltransferase MiaA [Deferribacter autotrophicus]
MRIPVITGPTATGKTDFVLKLTEFLDIEIISADAYQVYRYMDIGTAKPSKDELDRVKHHLIDILNPDCSYSAGDFFNHAETLINSILNKGKIPVIVGGTGLYVESLTKGIFEGPPRNEEIREELKEIAKEKGTPFLHDELKKIDPIYASKISENDLVRIIRALEVYKILKIPFTEAHRLFHKKPKFKYDIYVFYRNRSKLYTLINERVDKMFEKGWIDEVKRLNQMGYDSRYSSFKAIGYTEIENYLNKGGDINDVKDDIKKKTRRFAKRQFTWFKHMDESIWIDIDELDFESIKNKLITSFETI